MNFVHVTTDQSGPYFVPPQQRIAVFDQDGTTWAEHPVYTQFAFAVDQVDAQVETHPTGRSRSRS